MFDWNLIFPGNPTVLTVVGMAKNAGKTVTLNYLLKTLKTDEQSLGLTSIGRDGEEYDAITQLPKPSITVQPGTIVATTRQTMPPHAWERLTLTGISTPLGEVEILRATAETQVVLAGPSKNKDVKRVLNLLADWGAGRVLIDGAFDRQSSADPLLANQVILASGATLSRDLAQVIAQTKCRVEQLTLPACGKLSYLAQAQASTAKVLQFGERGLVELPLSTALISKQAWLKLMDRGVTTLIIKGAVGEGLGEALLETNNPPHVIVQDGCRIFISPGLWRRLRAQQVSFQVQYSINLLGVTVNPVFPGGKGLDPDALLDGMGMALYPMPVVDVMREKKFT